MELSSCYDTDLIKNENDNLLQQNRELRQRLYLLQENVELRNILEQSHDNPDETQPHGITTQRDKEDSKSNRDDAKPKMDSMDEAGPKPNIDSMDGAVHKPNMDSTDGAGHADGSRCQTDASKQIADIEKKNECGSHSAQNSYQLNLMQHIIGEIAFQLDRRILAYIFPDHGRLYGVTVANIPQKITEASTDRVSGKVDVKKKADMMQRYEDIMSTLKQYGYDVAVHPTFSENIVNVYGIMKEHPPLNSPEMRSLCDPANLKKIAYCTVPSSDLDNVLILLKCLSKLSRRDGKPVIML